MLTGMGEWKTATLTATTVSAEIDLGRDFARVLILVPDLGDSADVTITIAKESGGTFYPMYRLDADTATSLEGITAADQTAKAIILPCGAQLIKILCSASQTSETFYVRGMD